MVSALQVGSILNFSLMYFLAPTAGAKVIGANLLQKLFSEQTLLAWGAPGVLHLYNDTAAAAAAERLNTRAISGDAKGVREDLPDMQRFHVMACAERDEHTLLSAGGHMFEKGAFSLASRATNLAYKVINLALDPSSASPHEEHFPWHIGFHHPCLDHQAALDSAGHGLCHCWLCSRDCGDIPL